MKYENSDQKLTKSEVETGIYRSEQPVSCVKHYTANKVEPPSARLRNAIGGLGLKLAGCALGAYTYKHSSPYMRPNSFTILPDKALVWMVERQLFIFDKE